jgi:hypothetical protein
VPKQRLREDLARLQEDLSHSPGLDDEARNLVAEITRDVEALLVRTEGSEDEKEGLVDRLRSAASSFEESHPSLTAAVGRIADALSALGI